MTYLILGTFIIIGFSFTGKHLTERKEVSMKPNLVGEYFRSSGTSGATFFLDSLYHFRYYGWCDICPGTEIYGRWNVEDSLLILTDTIVKSFEPHFSRVIDTIIKATYREDTLIIRSLDDNIYLCHPLKEKMLKKISAEGIDAMKFGCYRKK